MVGSIVTTSGIVTANNVTSATSGVIGYFIQDGEGPWNGIYVYDQIQAPQIGDEIIIEGEVAEFYDVTELVNISYFETVSSGNDLPTPSIVTTGELASSEAYEGCLVQIVNAMCVNPDADYGEAIFDDGSGEVKTNDYMFWPEEGWIQDEYYSITGCIHYTFEEYKIEPRYSDDIVQVCNPGLDLDLGDWGYFPDPSLGQQFASAQVGEPYFDVFHISVPTDASAIDPLFALPLDSMKIVSFQLIAEETGVSLAIDEIGLQVTCNNLNFLNSECTFLSGFQYCTAIEGSPTTPGIYSMSIILESWVTVFGVPVAQPYEINGYSLIVEGGCENEYACNFGDLGNCEFPSPPYNCDGNCLNDADSDGVCDEDEILGCTYVIACNYNPNATDDDDSCEFYCPGCNDSEACNFEEGAIQDDGSCLYPLDIYGSEAVDCDGICLTDSDGDGICDQNEILGCTNPLACNFIPEATQNDGFCEFNSCFGCTYEYACNYDPDALNSDGSCVFGECSGCTDGNACNFNPTVADDDGSCTYAPEGYDCNGDCILDENSDGICDGGCTDPTACNYDEQSSLDDGSCAFPADYFDCNGDCLSDENENGICDILELEALQTELADGVYCGEGTVWDESSGECIGYNPCPKDLDGDGVIGIEDLLQLLNAFGTECPDAEEPSTSEWTCGDPVNYQGYDYVTVQIGEQCWFAENLRTELYQNGESIAGGLDDSAWILTEDGAVSIYDEGGALESINLQAYGRLYNGYAIIDNRGICPNGWHVSEESEWIALEIELGMSWADANSQGWRGVIGPKMKSSAEDVPSWNGSNSSGFSGLAGGARWYSDASFSYSNTYGYFWASSPNDELWDRVLGVGEAILRSDGLDLSYGFSVRCIKDTE